MNKFEMITLDQARRLSMEEGYIVIDLRSREEFDRSHVDNAVNIPDADIQTVDTFERFDSIWILYCRRGSLSFRLANEMAQRGYQVMAVVGGYRE